MLIIRGPMRRRSCIPFVTLKPGTTHSRSGERALLLIALELKAFGPASFDAPLDALASTSSIRFDKSGELDPPCGVPLCLADFSIHRRAYGQETADQTVPAHQAACWGTKKGRTKRRPKFREERVRKEPVTD